jgi:hypothetical protein
MHKAFCPKLDACMYVCMYMYIPEGCAELAPGLRSLQHIHTKNVRKHVYIYTYIKYMDCSVLHIDTKHVRKHVNDLISYMYMRLNVLHIYTKHVRKHVNDLIWNVLI